MENERRLRVIGGGGDGRDEDALPRRNGEGVMAQKLKGIAPRPGRPPVDCEECQDTKWVTARDGGDLRCPRCSASDRGTRLDRVMEASGVPRRYRRASLGEYLKYYAESSADPEYAAVSRHVEDWREASARGELPERGLYLRGGGRAATMLVCALVREAAAVAGLRTRVGDVPDDEQDAAADALYVAAPVLLDELRSSRDAGADPVAARRRISQPALLVLDALPERAEPAAVTRFAAALKIRDDEARTTVIVSRMSLQRLADTYGEDAHDIVRYGYDYVEMPLAALDAGRRA